MRTKLLLVSIVMLVIQSVAMAQNFGGHPPSLKWLQINTENIRIIFPNGEHEHATRVANLINYIQSNHLGTIGEKTKKIDLVLQTNQVISNGYVGLIPFRSEFFSTPFQNNHTLGSIDFIDGLAIHEYRHALQYSNANRGVTKLFHLISGQPGWTAAMNLSVPNWYFEGDAVVSETVLSSSGRGRTPEFFKEQRALLLNDIEYSYIKARNGSYKDMVPSHYPLGYAIMNYGRNHFGTDSWKKVIADAGAYSTILYPFSGAMNKHMGMRAPEMYRKSYAELKKQWDAELDDLILTQHKVLTPRDQKTVTNNEFPHVLGDGSIVYLSSSYKKTSAIYRLKNGTNTRLTSVGSTVGTFLSENNGKLAWVEFETDPRWSNKNFNKVVTYDLKADEKKIIANRTKLFSPEFSHGGTMIVAVQNGTDLKSNILLLDAESGTIIRTLTNPRDYFISYPTWTSKDNAIVYIAKMNGHLSIQKYDLVSNQITMLTPWSHHAIGNISVGKERVYFSASFTGIDNIFSVSLNGDQQIKQFTSSKIGAYQPEISDNEKTLIMSEFTNQGYIISSLNLSDAIDTVITTSEPSQMNRFNITLNKNEGTILDKIPEDSFEVKKYRGVLDGTKLHTWGIQSSTTTTGLSIGFSNILNNINGHIFGGINHNEGTYTMSGNLDYSKYFAVVSVGTSVTERNFIYYDPLISETSFLLNEFTQQGLNFGLSIPLTWQNGNYTTALSLESNFTQYLTNAPNLIGPSSWEPQLFFYNLHRQAPQHLQPLFGQYIFANYANTLSGSNGERFNIQAGLYLPGLFENHGILVEGEYQKELLTNEYQFSDYFNYARGYSYRLNEEISRLSVNYKLPLFYPDWGFFNFAYFKRVRANLFFDKAESDISFITNSTIQRSYGAELAFDTVMLNVLPMNFIFRQSFLPDAFEGRPSSNFEFFFQVTF